MDITPIPCDAANTPEPSGRRGFLRLLTALMGTVATAVLGLPLIGYFFGLRKFGTYWVDLGPLADFPLNETRRLDFPSPMGQPWDGVTALTGVYARYQGKNDKSEDQFLVLSVNCAHLGCPVSWFQQSGLFMCPCHGGVYYSDGAHASGPPPRGLFHVAWRVKDGRLEVQAPHYPTLQNPLIKPAAKQEAIEA
jgi:menaquinol-cytochrome c reductase iron-sulfur subunit